MAVSLMKLLFVVADLNVESGGVTAIVCGLSQALVGRGHAVTIATVDGPGTPATPAGVLVQRFPPDGPRGASRGLRSFLCQHTGEFDAVHIHGIWQKHGHYAAAAARRCGVAYLVAPHGMLDQACLRMGRRWLKRLSWLLFDGPMVRGAWAVHCLNTAEYRVAPWLAGMRTVVIGNGIAGQDLQSLPQRGAFRASHASYFGGAMQARPMALFLSRVHPKKGLDRLLAHWKLALARRPDLLLVIAGAGDAPYVDQLKLQCQREGIQDSVLWAGQLVGRDKWQALVDADVFVLASHQEGFSMAITESLAAGCPVVITEECHFDQVQQNNAGRVIASGDMTAFMHAVVEVVADASGRARMAANGQKLVRENYTWDRIAALAEAVYKNLPPPKP